MDNYNAVEKFELGLRWMINWVTEKYEIWIRWVPCDFLESKKDQTANLTPSHRNPLTTVAAAEMFAYAVV
jgi:hypothetical protein